MVAARHASARVRRAPLAALLLAVVAVSACGRKGPPLPPLVRVPAAVGDLAARRMDGDVYLTFTVPAENVDASRPADVRRVDVYALTAVDPPPHAAFLRLADRVASVPVAAAPTAADAPGREPDPAAGAAPGARVTVRVPEPAGTAAAPAPDATAPDATAPDAAAPPSRYYLAVPVSARERSNPSGRMIALPLGAPPGTPGALALTHTADMLTVTWGALPGDPAYNVYRAEDAVRAPDPGALLWAAVPPVPLNDAPLAVPAFSEPVTFGRARCYRVRGVWAAGDAVLEGDASLPGCLTPEDVFPPAAPQTLVAVAGPDGIALRWTANREADVGGYLILRGTPADATLLPITGTPVMETQFLDRDVVPGVRYVYAVVAVDSRQPTPNRSPESERDEATAR
jgi:predicted small lipoprotein YifL